eukprot:scaffold499_cov335-Pavlova_lutheri.AAC.43
MRLCFVSRFDVPVLAIPTSRTNGAHRIPTSNRGPRLRWGRPQWMGGRVTRLGFEVLDGSCALRKEDGWVGSPLDVPIDRPPLSLAWIQPDSRVDGRGHPRRSPCNLRRREGPGDGWGTRSTECAHWVSKEGRNEGGGSFLGFDWKTEDGIGQGPVRTSTLAKETRRGRHRATKHERVDPTFVPSPFHPLVPSFPMANHTCRHVKGTKPNASQTRVTRSRPKPSPPGFERIKHLDGPALVKRRMEWTKASAFSMHRPGRNL